ncbi:MAG: class I SAM-dependent methyltransferase [Alphaproteobacteria bacterium]|nr:class I SAM-dependent methyltransferase [Alphaproteobacteria bacterium]
MSNDHHTWLHWSEKDQAKQAIWQSDNGARLPTRVQVCTELDAAQAHRLASAGTGLLWRGSYPSARQLLQGMSQRLDEAVLRQRARDTHPVSDLPTAFARHRQAQGLRARVLGQLLIEVDGQYRIGLSRAPQVRDACTEAWGPPEGQTRVVALRALLGLIGAHEWRKAGVPISALGNARIHPHHGVFSPVRGEYLDLIAHAPLPAALTDCPVAIDVGVGTGVLSAVLLRRGVPRVLATDLSERAIACADDNLQRLGLSERVELIHTDLYPPGQAALVVCNPPWLPGQPSSALDQAIYDPDSAMLRGFLYGLRAHLCPGGEGWLVLSDLAERLGLRTRRHLQDWIGQAGLRVIERHDTRPRHPKASDANDPLHAARAAEVTSLWRLGVQANV